MEQQVYEYMQGLVQDGFFITISWGIIENGDGEYCVEFSKQIKDDDFIEGEERNRSLATALEIIWKGYGEYDL